MDFRRPSSFVSDQSHIQDLKAYLARPYLLTQGAFSQVLRGQVYTVNINRTFLNALPYYNRLYGALGFRATLVFRVQVAANPFQAGLLRLVWQPEAASTVTGVAARHLLANPISMLPGVYLDVCEQTSAVLRVPFVNHLNFIEIYTNSTLGAQVETNIGTFTLFAYLPLTIASGGGSPNYTIWLSFEDVELIGASSPSLTTAIPQSPEDAEAVAMTKPISTMLSKAVVVANSLSAFPSISPMATPASWFLSLASGLASAMGWSKPLITNAPKRVHITQMGYSQNVDGADIAFSLGASLDNHVIPEPGFAGSNIDEMAFSYLLSRPGLICNGSFSVVDTFQQVKYTFAVSPLACVYQSVYNPLDFATYYSGGTSNLAWLTTPLSFVGNTFAYWKGDIVLRFRVAKTKFHTGRYLIYYLPMESDANMYSGNVAVAPTVAVSGSLQYHSAIWDLREQNTLDFTIPYVYIADYCATWATTGNVVMVALDPLQAPSTVSTSVPFAVEVFAGSNFEFAGLASPWLSLAPATGNVYVSQSDVAAPFKSTAVLTSMQTCIGEAVVSVKQLISKTCYSHVGFSTNALNALLPFWNATNNFPTWNGSGSITSVYNPDCFCQYFTHMYAYARGGTCFDVQNKSSSSNNVLLSLPGPSVFFQGVNSALTDCVTGFGVGNAHFRMPFFGQTSRVLVDASPVHVQLPNYSQALLQTPDASALVYMRAAEDAQLGYFIGTPPLACLLSVANNTQVNSTYLSNLNIF